MIDTESKKGINQAIVESLSRRKNEPEWMLQFRLDALKIFESKAMPEWGADLSSLDPYDIHMYCAPITQRHSTWQTVPDSVKATFDKLGIPQAEQTMLAGVGAQFESEVIYKSLKKEFADQGVIFCSMDDAVTLYPDLVKKYFATVIPAHDNKFAALNSAVWSGGSFVYIPENVNVHMPLQAYFRIERDQMGQFERTLIIAEKNSSVHYVEGCSAPLYRSNSLHSAVVEIVAHESSTVRYTTIQNWAPNIYNLVTKRAVAYKNARVCWVDGNFGSAKTMKYPCIVMKEEGAQGEVISIAVAGKDQHQDSGAKMIHCAPHTRSTIVAKSISKDGGRSSYRGLVKVLKQAHHVESRVQCDALMLDGLSRSDTYPTIVAAHDTCLIGHEASASYINTDQLFYLMSRGLSRQVATALLINGFIDPFVQLLPMEYAVEINRLIEHEMEGSIG